MLMLRTEYTVQTHYVTQSMIYRGAFLSHSAESQAQALSETRPNPTRSPPSLKPCVPWSWVRVLSLEPATWDIASRERA